MRRFEDPRARVAAISALLRYDREVNGAKLEAPRKRVVALDRGVFPLEYPQPEGFVARTGRAIRTGAVRGVAEALRAARGAARAFGAPASVVGAMGRDLSALDEYAARIALRRPTDFEAGVELAGAAAPYMVPHVGGAAFFGGTLDSFADDPDGLLKAGAVTAAYYLPAFRLARGARAPSPFAVPVPEGRGLARFVRPGFSRIAVDAAKDTLRKLRWAAPLAAGAGAESLLRGPLPAGE